MTDQADELQLETPPSRENPTESYELEAFVASAGHNAPAASFHGASSIPQRSPVRQHCVQVLAQQHMLVCWSQLLCSGRLVCSLF